MKKFIFSTLLSVVAFLSLCAFTVNQTLTNTDYNHSIYLYDDGSLAANINGTRATGTYDLRGGRIYIEWANGESQQGSYTMRNGRLESIYVEGVRYTGETRRVRSRR